MLLANVFIKLRANFSGTVNILTDKRNCPKQLTQNFPLWPTLL